MRICIWIGVFALGAALGAQTARSEELCHGYSGMPAGQGPQAGMVHLPGGTFTMGSGTERMEERVAQKATVGPFWIDRHEVTNAQFAKFVEATGYRTLAERPADPKRHPGVPPELLVPGAMVFQQPTSLVSRADVTQWWRYVPGADWRHPFGPGSSIEGKENHPVVNVAYEDAKAYAEWLGRSLPTEAEWEFAALGGLEGTKYAWGDSYDPADGWKANTWQGDFPMHDEALDGFSGTAPVGCFPPNGYGLVDMIGNVWEYTSDRWRPFHMPHFASLPAKQEISSDAPSAGGPLTIKGGSWLCAPNFCERYRPSARQPQEKGLGAVHIGFRTILRD
jgi:formylglycine-generating enzyme